MILNGRAKVRAGSRRLTIGSGDFFGEMSLIDGDPRSATVTAGTDCLVMMLPRRRFLKLVESEPKVALAIMTTLSRRVRSLQAASVSDVCRAARQGTRKHAVEMEERPVEREPTENENLEVMRNPRSEASWIRSAW